MRGATFKRNISGVRHKDFNPRTPCGVRRLRQAGVLHDLAFQSTHPMRGATHHHLVMDRAAWISIHAPHAGCDFRVQKLRAPAEISIHAPHAGCDKEIMDMVAEWKEFQSTHPMRGATKKYKRMQVIVVFQSTHPMRGATTVYVVKDEDAEFQSTHPMRGATIFRALANNPLNISIHAPHAGCDGTAAPGNARCRNFNPRTPCGVRPQLRLGLTQRSLISIHAPHAGCDMAFRSLSINGLSFQSTHPMRGATLAGRARTQASILFQSTHPMRGATR